MFANKEKSIYYYLKVSAVCLTIIAAGIVTALLIYTKALMIPLVISIFIYTILAQMTLYMKQRFSFPSWLALTVSVLLCAAFFAGIVLFTVSSVGGFLKDAEVYRQNLIDTVSNLLNQLQEKGISIDMAAIETHLKDLHVFNWLKNFGGKIFSVISSSTLVILFMVFFFSGTKKSVTITNPAIKEMLANVSVYLSVKLIASIATGLVAAAILFSFNVKLAALFSLFVFLLNFIPSVGSIIAVLLPMPVLFLQYGLGPKFFIVIALLTATEFIIGNLLEPRFLGEGMDLHPVTVVASLIFWSLVWGVPGAFLSVPITASIKIVLSKLKHTRMVAELMAGRLPH